MSFKVYRIMIFALVLPFFALCSPCVIVQNSDASPVNNHKQSSHQNFEGIDTIADVYDHIMTYYVNKVDENKLMIGVLNQLREKLGHEYFQFTKSKNGDAFCTLSSAKRPYSKENVLLSSNKNSLLKLLRTIHEFYDNNKLKGLSDTVIDGMLKSLDPHSSFMSPKLFKEMQVQTSGSFCGVGTEITIRDDVLTVVSPIEGSPAFKAGVEPGDRIIKIDGEPTKGMTIMEVVKKIRGQRGTGVTISIMRDGLNSAIDFKIIRDVIKVVSVKNKMLANSIAYIHLTRFHSQTYDDLNRKMKELKKGHSISGLVLDLRNNPGGLLQQAVKVSDYFLKSGLIVYTDSRINKQKMRFQAYDDGTEDDYPMVILVNSGSASGTEIVAGALQDNHRAIVVGSKSFGKGNVQTIFPLNNGGALKITTSKFFTPKGHCIQQIGITPEFMVLQQEDAKHLYEKDLENSLQKNHTDDVEDPVMTISVDDNSDDPVLQIAQEILLNTASNSFEDLLLAGKKIAAAINRQPQKVAIQNSLPALPAQINLKVGFSEPSGNLLLDAKEHGDINVKVANLGPGEAHGVVIRVRMLERKNDITFSDSLNIGTIVKGETLGGSLPVVAGRKLDDGILRFEVMAIEENGFDADPVFLQVSTKRFLPPKLMMVDMGIDDTSQNGQIEPLELISVTSRIKNCGQGRAEDVKAQINLGENVYPALDSAKEIIIGDLDIGEYKDISFSFYTNKRIGQGKAIPVSLLLSEKRAGITNEISLALKMNVPQRSRAEVVIAGRNTKTGSTTSLGPTLAVDVDQNIPRGKKAGKYDVAVIIGNRNYKCRGVPNVEYAHHDLGVMREYLIHTMGYNAKNIIVEKDAGKATFETLFGSNYEVEGCKLWRRVRKGKMDKSRIFVYYVGHGAPNPKTGESYFVPVDADPDYISRAGYPLSRFYENLKKIPASEIVVVIDACFSGRTPDGFLFKKVSPALVRVKKESSGLTHGAVLVSSKTNQFSTWYDEKKHGLFTYFFLKGLRGEADFNNDRMITVGEMGRYLSDEVSLVAGQLDKEQDPQTEGNKDLVLTHLE